VEAVTRAVDGAADVYTEQISGQPVLVVKVDQDAIARHGVPAAHVLEMIEAIGGKVVGEVREGERRFDLAVRLAESFRHDPGALERILIPTAGGGRIPLTQLATIERTEGPSTVTREWQKRRIVVQANVRGRDVGGFVDELRARIAADVTMPPGYYVEFGGQFEHLERARLRLTIIVPMALALILFLLYAGTRSWLDSLIIFTGAPFAALGGVIALWWGAMPFTISAGIGFVAVSGVAMLNGLVLISTFRQLLAAGAPLTAAIERGALVRLRPVLMTALVAGLGFVPMMLNTGVGAEVQRPLATVVVGGIVSNTLLTLLVLPALYRMFGPNGSPHDSTLGARASRPR
jgi:cobalt-zinc-cadmium resistance protein CzcA